MVGHIAPCLFHMETRNLTRPAYLLIATAQNQMVESGWVWEGLGGERGLGGFSGQHEISTHHMLGLLKGPAHCASSNCTDSSRDGRATNHPRTATRAASTNALLLRCPRHYWGGSGSNQHCVLLLRGLRLLRLLRCCCCCRCLLCGQQWD